MAEQDEKYPDNQIWAKGIVIALTIFTVFIVVNLIFALFHPIDLIDPDYYRQAEEYQNKIDMIERGQSGAIIPFWEYNSAANELFIKFPEDTLDRGISGTIRFIRPADARRDFQVPLQLDKNRELHISLNDKNSGLWRVKFEWQVDQETYYDEFTIIIKYR